MQPLGMQIEMKKKSVGELRGGCAMSGLCLRMQSQTQLSPDETQFPIALDILYYHIHIYIVYVISYSHYAYSNSLGRGEKRVIELQGNCQ